MLPPILGSRLPPRALFWCGLASLLGAAVLLVYPTAAVLAGRQRGAAAAALIGLSVVLAALGQGASSRAVRALRPIIFGVLARAARLQPIDAGASRAGTESDIARGAPWIEAHFAHTLPALVSSGMALPVIAALAVSEVGVQPTILGGVGIGVAFSLAMFGTRYAVRLSRQSLDKYQRVARMIDRGMRGAPELRAHALGRRYDAAVLTQVSEWTHVERRGELLAATSAWSIPAVTLLAGASFLAVFGKEDVLRSLLSSPGRASVIGVLLAFSSFPVLIVLARSLMQAVSQRASIEQLETFVGRQLTEEMLELPPGEVGAVTLRGVELRRSGTLPGFEVEISADLDWPPGRSIALTGPTGAGKSSILLVLVGLLKPTRGAVQVEVNGCEVSGATLVGRVAYVPQHVYFDDSESIREAFQFMAPNASDFEMRAVLERLVPYPGSPLLDLDRTLGTLSAGEQRIVALGRALLRKSPLLVIDEPEMNLDHATCATVAAALKTEKRERRLLVATHHPEFAAVADIVLHFEGHAVRMPATTHPDARCAQIPE